MSGVNKVILVGNVGADPVKRATQGGAIITTLSVATSERWKDKTSGETQERTEWHRVKFFGRLAEIAAEFPRKGSQIYVEGSLRTEKYTDKDGIERYTTEVIASSMQMLGSRPAAPGASPASTEYAAARGKPARAAAPTAAAPAGDAFEDDDIPF